MHPVINTQIVYLKANKVLFIVFCKYTDFVDVFLPKLAVELFEYIKINNYIIELMYNWQPPYSLIYSLVSMKLETLKTYIQNRLINGFMKIFKSFVSTPIFFNKMSDGSQRLCKDYLNLNNLIIKNWYLLPFVRKLLD